MGMFKSSQLPPTLRRQMRDANRARAEVCCVGSYLRIRVPTVGLHDKTFAHRDSKALRAAKTLYAQSLPSIERPVAPPLYLAADFVMTPPALIAPFEGVLPYTHAPDLSNLVKVFEDALRKARWMVDDAPVVSQSCNKWISFDPRLQGVWFALSTLRSTEFDPGELILPEAWVIDDGQLRSHLKILKPFKPVYFHRGGGEPAEFI